MNLAKIKSIDKIYLEKDFKIEKDVRFNMKSYVIIYGNENISITEKIS